MIRTTNEETPGWPTGSGPLHTLHKLGLVQDGEVLPGWLKYPRTATDRQGAHYYRASALFLNTNTVRVLAALTFEGYHLTVTPYSRSFDIRIVQTA